MKTILFSFFAFVELLGAEANPLKVAIFDDKGAWGKGVPRVTEILAKNPELSVTRLKGEEIATGALRGYDLVIFTGGSGSQEAASIGEKGREEVRQFVRSGGGYVGICAGSYLACANFEWGLGILNARTVSPKWRRGQGVVRIGGEAFGKRIENREVHYANGPIIKSAGRPDLPEYEVLTRYSTELALNETPVGVMVSSPAMVRSSFGLGRVFISSPHPEMTEGLDFIIESAAGWAARSKGPTDELWKRLEAMEVDKLWLPGAIVDWKTGLPTGQPIKDAKSKHTHCSQFVAAVADRLAIPLLRPPEHGVVLLANAQFDWLASDAGKKAGWVRLVDGAAAQAVANDGRLVLASLKNPDATRPGHIAVVRPGAKSTEALAAEGPDIMQAGGTNALRTTLRRGFGNHKKEYDQIAFYAHVVELSAGK